MKFSELDYDTREILLTTAFGLIGNELDDNSKAVKDFDENFQKYWMASKLDIIVRYYEYAPEIQEIFDRAKKQTEKRFNISFEWDKY